MWRSRRLGKNINSCSLPAAGFQRKPRAPANRRRSGIDEPRWAGNEEMAIKVTGILGKKVGMTQLFDSKGDVRPVTVLQAGPCVVTQHKSATKDGYEAAQIGLVRSE